MTFQVKVNQYIQQHQLLEPNDRVLIGVSGGPDSLALLHYLNEMKTSLHIEIAVVTVDHGLRGEASRADLAYVETWCRERGILCYVKSVDVQAYQAKYKVNTQVAARILRYEAFYDVLTSADYHKLALAHHLDDQLETSLMAFVKSTSALALTGIPVCRSFHDKQIIRPFLNISRQAIETYIEQHDLNPRNDVSNLSDDYLRNRMRHHIIPNLKRENQNILTTNTKLREGIAEDEAFIQTIAEEALVQALNSTGEEPFVILDISELQKQALAVLRRIFRIIVVRQLVDIQTDYKHESQFIAMIHDPGNKVIHLPKDWVMAREYDTIIFRKTIQAESYHYQFDINDIPFSVYCHGYGTIRGEKSISQVQGNDLNTYTFPADAVQWPLHIRTKQPGDRMSYDGLSGSKKVNRIFIDEKLSPAARQNWPLVTDGQGNILCLPQLRKKTVSYREPSLYIKLLFLKNEGE